MRAPRTFPVCMHLIADPLIELDEPASRGNVDSYAVVYQLAEIGSDGDDLTLGIRYLDIVVVYREHWVILRREAEVLWRR